MQSVKGRILVTGAAGFIGSHLCDALLAQGHEVIGLDNFVSGWSHNLDHLLGEPRFSLVRHDVAEPIDLEVGAIFNLACPASPVQYQRDPVQTTRTSVLGALNMLELARRRGVPIFQASTSEVYGDPLVHPQTEDYFGNVNPIGPRACYDEGKRCAETLFFDYHRGHGVAIRVARIFNTYGPRMHPNDGRVVSNFIMQALAGEDLTIYGDGNQTRSFCYVDDLVAGILAFAAASSSVIGPVNLGNPGEFTIGELAGMVIELCDSSSHVRFLPSPQDDPRLRRPDIGKANRELGWQPRIALREGLAHTIAYFEDTLAGRRAAGQPG